MTRAAAFTTSQVAKLVDPRHAQPAGTISDPRQLAFPFPPSAQPRATTTEEGTHETNNPAPGKTPPGQTTPRRPTKEKATGLKRVEMDPSHRSLALSLGQLDDALDGPTAARLSIACFHLAHALRQVAKARGEHVSPALELLSQLHEATA